MLRTPASCWNTKKLDDGVYIEDCEGWWFSGCHSSVAEHWLHKPGVFGLIPGGFWPSLFSPQIHLISLYKLKLSL